MSTVSDILDAIVTALAADPTIAGYVMDVKPLPDVSEQTIASLLKRHPAIGVVAGGGEWEDGGSLVSNETGKFTVLCVNKNLRSPVAALTGGTASEKGVYDLVEDVRRVLAVPGVLAGLSSVFDVKPLRWDLLRADENPVWAGVEIEVIWRH